MPKKRRQGKIPTPSWEHSGGGIRAQVQQRSPRFWGMIAVGVVVALAVGLVGVAFISDYIADQRRPGSTAIRVDDTSYTVRYYTERLRRHVDSFGGPQSELARFDQAMPSVARDIIEESIMLRYAEEEGIVIDEENIDASIATRLGIAVEDEDFESRMDEEIRRTGLDREEFRRMHAAFIVRSRFVEKFTDEIPETAESVNYSQILVPNQAAADEVVSLIEDEGADFAELARERSLDTGSAEEGGEVGWTPRGVLPVSQEEAVFGLEIGEVAIFPAGADRVWVFTVTDKDPDRAVDELYKPRLADQALVAWVRDKEAEMRDAGVTIVNHMDLAQGDSNKVEYALRQVYSHLF